MCVSSQSSTPVTRSASTIRLPMRKSPWTRVRRSGRRSAPSVRNASSKTGCGSPRCSCRARSCASGSSAAGASASSAGMRWTAASALATSSSRTPGSSAREDLRGIARAGHGLDEGPRGAEDRIVGAVRDDRGDRDAGRGGGLQQSRLPRRLARRLAGVFALEDQPPAGAAVVQVGLPRCAATQAANVLRLRLAQDLGEPRSDRGRALGAAGRSRLTSLHARNSASLAQVRAERAPRSRRS